MSDTNRVSLAYVPETTFGVTPSGPPDLQEIRLTGESLKLDTTVATSQELRADRQIADTIRTGLHESGDINFELSYGAYDDFICAVLMASAWSSVITVGPAATISFQSKATAGAGYARLLDSANGFGSIVNYDWIRITGAAAAGNNAYAKVVNKISAGSLEVVVASATADFTDAAAGAAITVKRGAAVVNGTTFRSYTIERKYGDLTNIFAVMRGMAIETFNLAVNANAILTGSFGFMGKDEISASATVGDGGNTAAPANTVMNAIDNVVAILEGGLAYGVTSITQNLTNNLRQRAQVGTLGAVSIGTGTIDTKGTINAYFADNTVMSKYRNFTQTSIAFVLQGTDGGAYVIDYPKVKYTSGDPSAGGINGDVMANMGFQVMRHPTENITVRVTRFVIP